MDARDWDERYRGAELVWGLEPNRFVREQCQDLPAGTALDVACGEGRNALWLAHRGWQVTGTDFSAVAIARARTLTEQAPRDVRARLDWHVQDATTNHPEADSVDLVLVSYLHLPPVAWRTALTAAARAVRPGGHVLVVGHDKRNLTDGVSGPQDETLLYEPGEVATLLQQAVPDGVVEVAETVQRPTDAGIALDTLVRLRRP
jgi:SAM-dependent methyltransferase